MNNDESDGGNSTWWETIDADAQPVEIWKRLIPALVGIIAVLKLPGSLMYVAAAGMAFDAPGSENKIWPYVAAFWLSIYPLALVACAVFGFLTFRRFSKTRLVTTLAVPVIWWVPLVFLGGW